MGSVIALTFLEKLGYVTFVLFCLGMSLIILAGREVPYDSGKSSKEDDRD